MTNWEIVHGSQTEKPSEFDTISSEYVVYQRRNIKEVEPETDEQGNIITGKQWCYEERTMTKKEFEDLYTNSIVTQLSQARADIDYLSAMTDTDL